jgi:hypothetical protein
MTSVTLQTHPTPKLVAANLAIASLDLSAPWVWDMAGYLLSQFPYLDSKGISGYSVVTHNYSVPYGTHSNVNIAGLAGEFLLLGTENTADMQAVWDPIIAHVNATWPDAVALVGLIPYPSFASWLDVYSDKDPSGYDLWVGSHLLDATSLTSNSTAVGQAFKIFSGQAFLVSGNGTRNAKPRGGSNAINPSWRKTYVHASKFCATFTIQMDDLPLHNRPATGVGVARMNDTTRSETLAAVNAMTEPLRQLAPNMGAYLNEVRVLLEKNM